jgi:hypothetical protein
MPLHKFSGYKIPIRRGLIALVSLVLASSASGLCGAQESTSAVGFVIEIVGEWVMEGTNNSIVLGQPMPGGSKIKAVKPTRESSIAVALFDGDLFIQTCEGVSSCAIPSTLPTLSGAPTFSERLVDALNSLNKENRSLFATICSRGPLPLECILQIDEDGNLDVGQNIKRRQSGVYQFELRPIDCQGALGPLESVAVIQYEPEKGSVVKFIRLPSTAHQGLPPGLYELNARSDDRPKEGAPANSGSWVLLAGPDHYDDFSSEFKQILDLRSQWGRLEILSEEEERKKSLRGSLRRMLRAYLMELACSGNE